MRHVPALSLIGWAAFVCTIHAQGPPAPSTQTFRTGVELVLMDVSVLDEQRRPVRGLTQDDFSVVVDGGARPIVSFSPVELPPPPQNSPAHLTVHTLDPNGLQTTSVSADVSSRAHRTRRFWRSRIAQASACGTIACGSWQR
jgi:hypothetical protein